MDWGSVPEKPRRGKGEHWKPGGLETLEKAHAAMDWRDKEEEERKPCSWVTNDRLPCLRTAPHLPRWTI
jgi:hypothetical protein